MEFTEEQKQAIFDRGCNILVAAGAGSGKTAVLVERIINKIINDGVDIDKLLVVTFTRAAAGEMKERIADRLYKEVQNRPELQKQITLLSKANITTIDAFCLKIVKDNFFKINIDPNFRLGDSGEIELLKMEAMEELLEQKYDEDSEDLYNVINIYTSSKDDDNLQNIIKNIYNFTRSSPFPNKWLDEKLEEYNVSDETKVEDTIWGKYALNYTCTQINMFVNELQALVDDISCIDGTAKYVDVISQDIAKLSNLATDARDSYDKMYEQINNFDFTRATGIRGLDEDTKNQIKTVRDAIKEKFNKKLRDALYTETSEELIDDFKYLYSNLSAICKLVKDFADLFLAKKLEKNMLDFSDVSHYALDILTQNEDIASNYRDNFEEILIDEYQDSNLIQEYILKAISKDNIFMVGDVKQSIYRFRQARPELFLEKYNSFPNASEKLGLKNEKILLFKNFRSNQNIIDEANFIFERIMSKDIGDIDYTEEEFLKFGANYYEKSAEKAELNLIETDPTKDVGRDSSSDDDDDAEDVFIDSNSRLEAKFVAKRIKELVGNVDVYDKKLDKYRKATFKDCVILMRSTVGAVNVFTEELSNAGIPVYSDNGGDYFANTEVQVILNTLHIIDNPIQDIPLISVLRSQIGGFSIDELSKIRVIDRSVPYYDAMLKYLTIEDKLSYKIKAFLDKLSSWREMASYSSIWELLWRIYNETGYYYYVSLFPDGIKRQANLKLLLERAERYENTSFKGLFTFLNYIDNIKTSSNDYGESKVIGENENVVRIMSIHKSKGLEFPIVFISNTAKKFNTKDLNGDIIYDQDFGFGMDVIDYDNRIKYHNLSKSALAIKSRKDNMSEEMRILYVALTRAREKLIVTGLVNDLDKADAKYSGAVSKFKIQYSHSILDWIAYATYQNAGNWIVNQIPYDSTLLREDEIEEDESNSKLKQIKENCSDYSKAIYDEIDEQMKWQYFNMEATKIPNKVSISELKRKKAIEELGNEEGEAVIGIDEINNKIKPIISKPEYLEETTNSGTSFGTNIHMVLQKLDFANPKVEELVNSLVEDKKQRVSICRRVNKFLDTSLCKEIINAQKVYRETSFNLNIKAKEIYKVESDEEVMIQGIIDLYFIDSNGRMVLVDYKSDNVENSDELVKRYKLQLDLYKRALEEITGVKVYKTIIYSLKLEQEIEL